jgi:hypothetical protein
VINALLVRWAKGWHEVSDAAAVGLYGRHEGTLALGVEQSVAEVERVGAGQLAVAPREEIAVDLDPTGPADTPYAAFAVGDVVGVPGTDGLPAQERVMALTVAEDENGRLSWVPELKDVLLTQAERTEQALAKMANGSLGGTSAVASPLPNYVTPAPIPKTGGGGGTSSPPVALWGVPGLVYPQGSATWTTPVSCTLAGVTFSFTTPPTGGTHRVALMRDGAEVWSASVPAGLNPYTPPAPPALASAANATLWRLVCTSVGAGSPAGMGVAVRYA